MTKLQLQMKWKYLINILNGLNNKAYHNQTITIGLQKAATILSTTYLDRSVQ